MIKSLMIRRMSRSMKLKWLLKQREELQGQTIEGNIVTPHVKKLQKTTRKSTMININSLSYNLKIIKR